MSERVVAMSQRSGSARAAARKRERQVEIKGDPAFFKRINYPAVAAGFLAALVVYVGVVYLSQFFLLSPSDSFSKAVDVYAGTSFIALYVGGLVAGLIEPKYGVLNGPLVAVLFILVTWLVTFNDELVRVKIVGPFGLGPMRVDRVFATDLPQLAFSSLGGFTAGMFAQWRAARRAKARADG
jgi:hypothetical protein